MIPLRRILAVVLSLSLINGAMIQSAAAAMVSTEEVARLATPETPESGRSRLSAALARADVRAALENHGVSADQASARVAALSDEEAGRLADRIEQAPAGSGDFLGAILLILIILLVTDILGLTKVYPFTRSVR